MNDKVWAAAISPALLATVFLAFAQPSEAATLCVNQGGTGNCYSSISDAAGAANPYDTITVATGIYNDDVVITKPLSIVGAGPKTTIVDASGEPNGFYVDGLDTPSLSTVTIKGFTVENAQFEGILVTDASSVTIIGNIVVGNDAALSLGPPPSCPGMPSFETLEGFDCGEGIHLLGATSSVVSNNLVEKNAGGILLSDDTGPASGNLITGNIVRNNPFDCGITLASHSPYNDANGGVPFGVFNNVISSNRSVRNGLGAAGAGAGVGLFASVPGAATYQNTVIGNVLKGNGLPGVAMHSHAPDQNLGSTIIADNFISANGADTEDAATPGPTGINIASGPHGTPITGVIVGHNTIKNETDDVAIKTGALVDVHANNLLGKKAGLNNLGTGTVNATENWWGCAGGPGAAGCTWVGGPNVISSPYLPSPIH